MLGRADESVLRRLAGPAAPVRELGDGGPGGLVRVVRGTSG